jgi:hypothetical protein
MNKTLRTTPTMAAGVTDWLWEIGDSVAVKLGKLARIDNRWPNPETSQAVIETILSIIRSLAVGSRPSG